MSDEAQRKIEAYLSKLRARLRGLKSEDAAEIVEELRSHILDKAAGSGELTVAGVDAALAGLGDPEELASQYITYESLARAEVSRSPVLILHSLFRWASLSVAGFFVLVSSVMGYALGILFVLLAVLKPLHPQNAGLWVWRDSTGDLAMSFRMGFGGAPSVGREVLGWWVLPLGLLFGCALLILTTRFALWCARQYRGSHGLPRG